MNWKNPDLSLELSGCQMKEMVDKAAERIVSFVESLPQQPSFQLDGAEKLSRSLIESLPETGVPYDEILHQIFEDWVHCGLNTTGPGYLAYIPGGGLPQSAVADLIADSVNRFVGAWVASPTLVQLETNVIRWFCRIVGYPQTALGFLTTGGSLANFSAVVTARVDRLPENFFKGTLYTSDQAHHSLRKAARLAGFPASSIRSVPSDRLFRIRIDALEAQMEEDIRQGLQPFLVVGSAGTTNTGAVDDLEGLAAIARRRNCWLHVDAAYGGFFLLTGRGRQAMRGIEKADSIALDPHKGLFLPYGTGCLLVRHPSKLQKAHSAGADYLPAMQSDPDLVDFCEISPELSRDFRGLRVWLPLKLHGLAPFRACLQEKLDLAEWITHRLQELDSLEIVAFPQLSILAFRLNPGDLGRETLNQLNRQFLREINHRRRIYLTPTTLHGDFVLRICVLSFRTHLDRMEQALEDIRAAAEKVLHSLGQGN